MPKRVNKADVLHAMLHAFVEGSGFKEQDFLRAIYEFIPDEDDPDQTQEQCNARVCIEKAIEQLNKDDKR